MGKSSQVGEREVIERMRTLFPPKRKEVLQGIGDDAAVFYPSGPCQVVTTDLLLENIHFIRDKVTPFELGYKVVAVNLSDLAAKGAAPLYALLSLTLPSELEMAWVDQLAIGMKTLFDLHHVDLIGGNTTRTERDIGIHLTLIGVADENHLHYRTQAQEGDLVVVTGTVGDAKAGFLALNRPDPSVSEEFPTLHQAHCQPYPFVKEGIWLSRQEGVHAMMDVSDGLASDLEQIAQASQVGMEIQLEHIPQSEALKAFSTKYGYDCLKIAVEGGEEYVLLLTVAPDRLPTIQRGFFERFQRPLFPVGKVTSFPGVHYLHENQEIITSFKPFQHFNHEQT